MNLADSRKRRDLLGKLWGGNGVDKAFENAWLFVWFLEDDIPDDSMVCPDGSIVLFWDDVREIEFTKDGRVLKRPPLEVSP